MQDPWWGESLGNLVTRTIRVSPFLAPPTFFWTKSGLLGELVESLLAVDSTLKVVVMWLAHLLVLCPPSAGDTCEHNGSATSKAKTTLQVKISFNQE